MRVLKKFLSFLVMLMLCVGVMATPVLAASVSQDGLEITLTTNKERYSKGESIMATLTVKNTNDFAVKNVSLKNVVPEGYELEEGSNAIKQVKSLGAGETIELTVTYRVEDVREGGEEKPGDEKSVEAFCTAADRNSGAIKVVIDYDA